MSSFGQARLKIDWANEHIQNLEAIIQSLPDACHSSIEIDSEGRGHSIRYEIPNSEKIDTRMSLLIGDAVNNLKGAIDYAWVFATGAGFNRYAKFPVLDDEPKLMAALNGAKIASTFPKIYKRVVSDIKPYEAGNYHLWALHKLDNINKHQFITPVMKATTLIGMRVKNQHGSVEGESFPLTGHGPFYFDFSLDTEIEDKGKPSISVVIGDGLPAEGLEVMETLQLFCRISLNVVEILESVS